MDLYILVLSLRTWTSACFAAFVSVDIVTCDANTKAVLLTFAFII